MNNIILIPFVILIMLYSPPSISGNGYYINLSNQIARKQHLNIVANNVANASTNGYEADNVDYISYSCNIGKEASSYIITQETYRSKERGALLMTNNPLDLALTPVGYFKLITPRGERYTLNGSFLVNSEGMLVDAHGNALANEASQVIEIGHMVSAMQITYDGSIYVGNILLDKIGVFDFENQQVLVKEGSSVYYSNSPSILAENYTIISGALVQSNVNSAKAMVDLIELQKSYSGAVSLMNNIAELDRNTIAKLMK